MNNLLKTQSGSPQTLIRSIKAEDAKFKDSPLQRFEAHVQDLKKLVQRKGVER